MPRKYPPEIVVEVDRELIKAGKVEVIVDERLRAEAIGVLVLELSRKTQRALSGRYEHILRAPKKEILRKKK